MKKILTYGSLRKDITFFVEFPELKTSKEVKSQKISTSIGGSVYNSSRFVSEHFEDAEVDFVISNRSSLVDEIATQIAGIPNLHIKCNSEFSNEYPLTIITVDSLGEKMMISYDAKIDNTIGKILECGLLSAQLFYSSFYEIDDNLLYLADHCFHDYVLSGGYVMIDLCPLINDIEVSIINKILSNITILSGNSGEFSTLLNKLNFTNIEDFLVCYSNIQSVWVKQGEHGASAYIKDSNGKYFFISERIKDIVYAHNTTGCGDIFNAVVAYGIVSAQNHQKILLHAVQAGKKIASGGIPWRTEAKI